MQFSIPRLLFVLTAVVVLLAPTAAWAQVTGTFGGTVQDSTGALIPGADISLTSNSTGVVRNTISSDNGAFVFASLPVATYVMRVEMPGFSSLEQTDISVESGSDRRQNFSLRVGQVSETVTVEGGAVMVDTVGSEQRSGIGERQIDVLPNANRNITNLLELNPAVTVNAAQGNRSVRLNGMGGEASSYTMDGVEASGGTEGNIISQYQSRNNVDLISTEGIVEVQVVKGIVPAEVSNTVSGQVNVISRSGTSEVHGTVFEMYQSHNFNGRNPFLATTPKSVYNQYGASVGFPVVSTGVVDQSFGFVAWESYRDSSALRRSDDVPTQYSRDRALSSPAFDDAERAILNQVFDPIPLPNTPSTLSACDSCGGNFSGGQYNTQRSELAQDDTFLAKGDIHFTDGSHVAFTYNRLDPDFNQSRIVQEADREWHDSNNRVAVNWDKATGTWVFESRFGYTLIDQNRPGGFFENNQATVLGEETFFAGLRLPRINVRGNGEFGTLPGETWNADSQTFNVDNKIGYISGNHHIKFGGSWRLKYGNRGNPEMPSFTYNAADDFFNNRITNNANYTFGEPIHNLRTFMFGGFIQDDWKVTPRFTLNVGLRYDFTSNAAATRREDTGGRDVVYLNLKGPSDWNLFDFGTPRLGNAFEHDPINLSPRLGFNFNPDGEGRTVIRGGFGMMSAGTVIGVWRDPVQDGLFLPRRQVFRGDVLAGLQDNDGFRLRTLNQIARDTVVANNSVGTPTPFTTVDENWTAPYSMNWTLGVQRELVEDLLFEVDYVGQRGVQFPMFRQPNAPNRQTGVTPNPALGGIVWYVDTSQQSFYNAMQMNLRKRFTRNISYGFTYAFGKSLATGGSDLGTRFGSDNVPCCQDFFRHDLSRGRITGDITHNMTSNWYWQLPGPDGGAAGAVLGGWSFSGIVRAQTGTPIGITQNGDFSANRPNIVGTDPQAAKFDNAGETLQFWNPANISLAPNSPGGVNLVGNANRSLVSRPNFWGSDLSFAKDFSMTEDVRVQFRWDLINAFNHINEGAPRSNFSGSRFGRIERIAGGVRTSQINLKLIF